MNRGFAGSVAAALLLLCALTPCASAQAQGPVAPPSLVRAIDAPNDEGRALSIAWEKTPLPSEAFSGYAVLRRLAPAPAAPGDPALTWRPGDPFPPQGWEISANVPPAVTSHRDSGLEIGRSYIYLVAVMQGEQAAALSAPSAPGVPRPQWFHSAKGFLLLNLVGIAGAILTCVWLAGRGWNFTIRKIAGLDAVEEAVGRSTEMGKSILFVPGIQDMDNVQTVAGMSILSSIASMAAKYETKIDVPVSKSLVMSTGRETVKEAYTTAGRPDLFHEDIVHYVTDEQFGYVAAIDGTMLRERPAACFYMGAFFAESLILAETGNSIGAIQIAGTAQPTQLPFFVAACDYTLIGEELFAASAYLSKSPQLLGSLRGQDIGKAVAMFFIVVGVLAETVGRLSGEGSPFLAVSGFLQRFFATSF
jgi:hypothetical protein